MGNPVVGHGKTNMNPASKSFRSPGFDLQRIDVITVSLDTNNGAAINHTAYWFYINGLNSYAYYFIREAAWFSHWHFQSKLVYEEHDNTLRNDTFA